MDLHSQLSQIIPAGRIHTRPIDRIAYANDASYFRLVPQAVVQPNSIGEIQSLFKFSQQNGLFRTEFLYLGSDVAPDEQVQFDAYRKVAEVMSGKPVVIRTLDLGAEIDKPGLHTRKHPRDLAAVDVSDRSSVTFALNKKLSQGSFFDDRYTGLGSLSIDHEHVLHESSAICCDRSGASRHPCRNSGTLGVGSRGFGSMGNLAKEAIAHRSQGLA